MPEPQAGRHELCPPLDAAARSMNAVLDDVLLAGHQIGASDVHLKAGLPPLLRIKGELRPVSHVAPLTREAVQVFALTIMSERQRETFYSTWDVDLAYATEKGVRYRVNCFQQRGAVGMVIRLIAPEVPPFERLNLPATVLRLAEADRGLVLVTGITGAGKSTTLAAMVDYINGRRPCHIVTIEDPVEYVFHDRRAVINQREVGFDTTSFAAALRAALRQDPDVILVGEMRDLETIETGLTAAETGHLVLSTLHTTNAMETINRIVSVYPPHQQEQARQALASVLRGVISQRLVRRADGEGMVPAVEIMVVTARIRELIQDPKRTREIQDAIATGRDPYGMVTFDQSLTELVHKGFITYEDALRCSTNPEDFALVFRGVTKGGATTGIAPPTQSPPQANKHGAAHARDGNFEIERFKS